ncbi:hypothetical protein BH11BAC1_BH11BAC1_06850 [soil metagenome]
MEHTLSPTIHNKGAVLSILDESLFTGEQKPYRLLCTVDPEFISIAAVDPLKNKFFGFEGFHLAKPHSDEQLVQKIAGLPLQSTLLKKVDFRNVSVQFTNNRFTFIPAAIFKAEDSEAYFNFNQPKRDDESLHYDTIRGYDAVNIFTVPDLLIAGCKKMFEKFNVHHHLTSLLDAARFHSQKQSGKSMFIHLHSSWLDIIVLEERKLLFANSFSAKSIEDVVYFVMMVCEQLALNTDKATVILSGEVEKETGLAKELQQYIRHISFGERIRTVSFTYGFDELPAHYYHAAFSHILCES